MTLIHDTTDTNVADDELGERPPQRHQVRGWFGRRRGGPEVLTPAETAAAEAVATTERAAREALRAPRRAGSRGWAGPGGGASLYVNAPTEWRGTSNQVAGLWPFVAGSGSPIVGVPLGRNLRDGATVGCDPISYFQRAKLIANPSVMVLALPGLGKSSVVRRMALGLAGYGNLPMVLGDLKPDYVDLVRAMGGQVIDLGVGRGSLNVLDPGEATAAVERLTGEARRRVLADAHARRTTMVGALITIMRHQPPKDHEETIIDQALKILDDKHTRRGLGVPVLADLLQVIRDAPQDLRDVVLDRGKIGRYQDKTEKLEATLIGLISGGRLGDVFSNPTTVPMRRDAPVVFDVSSVEDSNSDLQAAVLMACWSYGFGAINTAHELADAGLEPARNYFIVLDELWRALRAGRGMVDRVDALTRLNRQRGVGMAMISHTMSDLQSMPDVHDQEKAKGFVERAGMVLCGGLPARELRKINDVIAMSHAEQAMVTSWSAPPSWDADAGREAEPPGLGRFLIKVGGRPGIPVQVTLTHAEMAVNDTNKRWHPRPTDTSTGADYEPDLTAPAATPLDPTTTEAPDVDPSGEI